jgi:hypothetical protein
MGDVYSLPLVSVLIQVRSRQAFRKICIIRKGPALEFNRVMMDRTRESLCVALMLNALSYFGQSKSLVPMRRLADILAIPCIPYTWDMNSRILCQISIRACSVGVNGTTCPRQSPCGHTDSLRGVSKRRELIRAMGGWVRVLAFGASADGCHKC